LWEQAKIGSCCVGPSFDVPCLFDLTNTNLGFIEELSQYYDWFAKCMNGAVANLWQLVWWATTNAKL